MKRTIIGAAAAALVLTMVSAAVAQITETFYGANGIASFDRTTDWAALGAPGFSIAGVTAGRDRGLDQTLIAFKGQGGGWAVSVAVKPGKAADARYPRSQDECRTQLSRAGQTQGNGASITFGTGIRRSGQTVTCSWTTGDEQGRRNFLNTTTLLNGDNAYVIVISGTASGVSPERRKEILDLLIREADVISEGYLNAVRPVSSR